MKAPNKQALLELPVPQNLLKRIRAAEMMIMEESMKEQILTEQENNPNNEIPSTGRKEEEKSSTSLAAKNAKQSPKQNLEISNPSIGNKEEPIETQKLNLFPIKIPEDELLPFLLQYQARVSPPLHQSYCPLTELLEKSQTGYTPYWLSYSYSDINSPDDQTIQGLAVFYIDPSCKARTRVSILHATVAGEESKFGEFLSELLAFIWKNVNCDEIRVGLAHIQQQEDKTIPYDPLKNAYQDLKFRWKTLSNDDQGNRILILGMNRPENAPYMNLRSPITTQEPISYKHAVLLALGTKKVPSNNNEDILNNYIPISQCSYLDALLSLKMGGHVTDIGTILLSTNPKNTFYSKDLIKSLALLESLVFKDINLVARKLNSRV